MAQYYRRSGSYAQHLQANAYVTDIVKGVGKTSRSIQSETHNSISSQTKSLVASNEALSRAFSDNFSQLSNSLDMASWTQQKGLESINDSLGGLENSIAKMGASFDYSIGLVIDQQKITNDILKRLVEVTELPDREKSRRYYIKQGLESYKYRLYPEALGFLLQAESLDATDHNLLFRIGSIKLNVSETLDVRSAFNYFQRAFRYSSAKNEIEFAAMAALNGAFASFILQDDNQALGLCTQAYQLNPELAEAHYLAAKIFALNGKEVSALSELHQAIQLDRNYCLRADGDKDFDNCRSGVIALFSKLKFESKMNADELYPKICKIEDVIKKVNPTEFSYFDKIEVIKKRLTELKYIYSKSTYFDYLDFVIDGRKMQKDVKLIWERIYG